MRLGFEAISIRANRNCLQRPLKSDMGQADVAQGTRNICYFRPIRFFLRNLKSRTRESVFIKLLGL